MSKKNIHKIKTTIYQKVEQLNDETLLQMVEEAVTAYGNTLSKDMIDELTPEQQQRLHESIKQADNGQTIPHEEVKQKTKEWLSR
jgi:predicted transcriptional regulator